MRTVLRDFRQALRALRRQPAFAFGVVATLAFGLGANTVIFSFANAALLRPLPLRDPQTLGWIFGIDPHTGNDRAQVSLPDYAAWRAGAPALEALAGRLPRTLTLGGRDLAPVRVQANAVVGDLHHLWGLRAELGRPLAAADEAAGSPRVVVLSHRFWQRVLGGRSGIVGQSLWLNGAAYEVVGVLSPEIEYGSLAKVEAWVAQQGDPALVSPERHDVRVVGRLRPGATVAEASAQVAAVAARLQADEPATHHGWGARVVDTKGALAGPNLWTTLALLLTVVGLLLLLACANVTNLFLARLMDRRRDFALRAALGASRAGIVRGLVAEGLVLGALGGALGLLVAAATFRGIRAISDEPFFEQLTLDHNVLLFALLLACTAPLLFVLPAALRTIGREPADALREGGRGGGGGVRLSRGRDRLVVAQVGLALTLLIVAGLIARSVLVLMGAPLGFDPRPLLTLQVELGDWKYTSPPQLAQAQRRLLESLAALPGVDRAALLGSLPVLEEAPEARFRVEGQPEARPDDAPWAGVTPASEGLFAALGLPLVAGRGFGSADQAGAPAVAVVNFAAAKRYWGGAAAALGSRVVFQESASTPSTSAAPTPGEAGSAVATVIGVVGDINSPETMVPTPPQIYLAAAQRPPRAFSILLRSGRPAALGEAVRRAIARVDPDLAIYRLRTMDEALRAESASDRAVAGLFIGFAGLALLLAAVGLYGVMAYAVAQRRRELAVRLACGAAPRDLLGLLLGHGMRLALLGSAAGLLFGLALGRLMRAKLSGISPSDPATLGAALGAVLMAAALASIWPALRARRVNPAEALRGD